MKLRDLFNNGTDLCLDVYNDYMDEDLPAIETSVHITPEGLVKYRLALSLELNECDEDGIEVHCEDDFQFEDLKAFCWALAGYIGDTEYDKYFIT